ncbi:hypothetical protein GBAR_LOCUS26099 [Geodia barretti]|uniref:Uncharacterized protein n=1 Tax=Geodia barretti TaxID=519541 RepID=A0AA35TFX7_GEOBA|nr:hypothetical protein GBAR_LOCUS26099 [Geodia barretti]
MDSHHPVTQPPEQLYIEYSVCRRRGAERARRDSQRGPATQGRGHSAQMTKRRKRLVYTCSYITRSFFRPLSGTRGSH